MKHFFLDTDVILDFLGRRHPFALHARMIFIKAEHKEVKLYTSGNSITTIYYLLSKLANEKIARSLTCELMEYVHIVPVTDKILKLAFNSNFKDFEDAVQFFCALTVEDVDCIVTRNIRDYKKSSVPVLSSEQVFDQ
jgi:predicted nucleic acid-binding protein